MSCWTVAYLLLVVVVRLAQPSCYLCEQQCYDLPVAQPNFTRISIVCDQEDYNTLVSFIDKNNFTNLQSLRLKSPSLLTLNLTKFHNVSNLSLSENNITSVNLAQLYNSNYSQNSNNDLAVEFSNLTQLNLSHNLINNFSSSILQKHKLSYLYLQNNVITSIGNISSNTLKYLDLNNNQIEKLELGYCPSLKQLTLSNNIIEQIQIKIYSVIPNVETINLSYNHLTTLEDYSFNLTNLLQLDLRNNKIHSLSQKCFSGLNRLQVLDISSNRIRIVSPSTFQYLSGLFHLVVSENRELSSQDFGLLLATRRLKSVYASKTNQKKIPSSLTRSVRYLVLSFNNISQIQCGDLDSYPLLNSLDLENNNISYIEDDALGRLELLTSINLNDNFLITVPNTLPNNLKYLFLRNNKIKSISNNDFTGIPQLSQLDLSFNSIEELKEGSFSQLYGLEKLNISGNQIDTFPYNAFSGLQNLKILDLSYLLNFTECKQALCFPVPDYNQLQELRMKNSPVLANTFMNDLAALKTFEQLVKLDMSYSNITYIRKDFPTYLARLNNLDIEGNAVDCALIEHIFIWSHLKEVKKCMFIISEDHPKDQILTSTTVKPTNNDILKGNITKTILKEKVNSTDKHTYNLNENTTEIKEDFYYENKTETRGDLYFGNRIDAYNVVAAQDILSNELFKNSSPGIVDAYSSETPASHPGLFVLLLLPIAVVSTCLFLNYSRIKRNTNNLINAEKDIEISNISSELW